MLSHALERIWPALPSPALPCHAAALNPCLRPSPSGQDLEETERQGLHGRISIFCIAESLDRKPLEAALRKRGGAALLHQYPDVLYGHFSGPPGSSAPIAAAAFAPTLHAASAPAATAVADGSAGSPLAATSLTDGLSAATAASLGAAYSALAGLPGEVFYFDYGVVACWGLTAAQERDVLRSVGPFLVDKLPASEVEMDEFQYVVTVSEKPHIQNDTITSEWGGAGEKIH